MVKLSEVQRKILIVLENEILNLSGIQRKIEASHYYTVSNNVKKLKELGYLKISTLKRGGFGKEYKIELTEEGKNVVQSIR